MKTRSPLAKMDKHRQRCRLRRDVQRYLQAGSQIRQLNGGRAQGTGKTSLNSLIAQKGFYREI